MAGLMETDCLEQDCFSMITNGFLKTRLSVSRAENTTRKTMQGMRGFSGLWLLK
jgi:hypothetical protein